MGTGKGTVFAFRELTAFVSRREPLLPQFFKNQWGGLAGREKCESGAVSEGRRLEVLGVWGREWLLCGEGDGKGGLHASVLGSGLSGAKFGCESGEPGRTSNRYGARRWQVTDFLVVGP